MPGAPTVAFTRRDVRSPGIVRATAVARAAGFEAVVRAPGGRMVAYDEGAVVVDHVTRFASRPPGGRDVFAVNAEHHANVLRSLGVDARIGAVEGEYCPGEFSVNVGGRVKVVGSAQRITPTGTLFSAVVQVVMSERVREVLVAVSDALGYPLRTSTVGGLSDAVPELTPDVVASALSGGPQGPVPEVAATDPREALPFDVDAWARTATSS